MKSRYSDLKSLSTPQCLYLLFGCSETKTALNKILSQLGFGRSKAGIKVLGVVVAIILDNFIQPVVKFDNI